MAISLRKAFLHREVILDSKKKPIVNGKKAAYVREQVLDNSGRVVKSRTRDISRGEYQGELTTK